MPTSVPRKYTHNEWLTMETLEQIDERKHGKAALNNSQIRSEKIGAQAA